MKALFSASASIDVEQIALPRSGENELNNERIVSSERRQSQRQLFRSSNQLSKAVTENGRSPQSRAWKRCFSNYVADNYNNVGDMIVPCRCYPALQIPEERSKHSSKINLKFSTWCSNWPVWLPLGTERPRILRLLLTEQSNTGNYFKQFSQLYNNAMSMGSVTAKSISQGPEPSLFHWSITFYGCVYHYVSALLPPWHIPPAFLSVYIRNTESATQTEKRGGSVPQFHPQRFSQMTTMLHDVNLYVKTFVSLRDWTLPTTAPNTFCMVSHEKWQPANEYLRR